MRYGESETTVVPAYVKFAKNEKGALKLADEISFYRSVTDLRVPRVLSWNPFTVEAVDGRHATAEDYKQIVDALTMFHQTTRIGGESNIRYELFHKLKARYQMIETPCMNIKTVNGVPIGTFQQALNFLEKVEIPETYTCMIHGDPHFGNVLIDYEGPVFIDPKGSFGGRKLYGVPEYDLAKVHLSLSGYNELEELDPVLDIDSHGNLKIPITIHPLAFKASNLTKLLLASIWLGNAPGFTGTRRLLSHYYALYIFKLLGFKK